MNKFLCILLLFSCSPEPTTPNKISCNGDICCYPVDKETLACISGNSSSAVYYIKLIK